MSWTFAAWYHHAPVIALSALLYALLARMALGLVVPRDFENKALRLFLRLTDPTLRAVAAITPGLLRGLVVPVAAFWIFALRSALLLALIAGGLAR
jgi:uncharacterized protein YggT (Ycf19 family)